MFSVSYDYHKVSLGCWSSQPAAIEATSPLSHEMTWQATRREAHNTDSMMLILHTHKTPKKMLTQYQHVLICRGTRKRHSVSDSNQETFRKRKVERHYPEMIRLSSPLFPSCSSFLLSFLMGTEGTDGESSYRTAPFFHLPPSLMFVS